MDVGPGRTERLISSVARRYAALPEVRGKWRMLYPLASRLVAEVQPGVWIHLDPRVTIERQLLMGSLRFDAGEIAFLAAVLRPGMVAVDVGAYIGVMALVMSSAVGPAGRVIAFEAGPPSVLRLVSNRELNRAENLTIVAAAVGDREGLIDYHYYPGTPDQSSIGYTQEGEAVQSIRVPMVTLDACLPALTDRPIDLVKIDVEGAEPLVVAGARKTLSGDRAPLLLMELNPGALRWASHSLGKLVAAIHDLGFELRVIEVAETGAYANVLGCKPKHRRRFPSLDVEAWAPLLTHRWYADHVSAPGP